MKTFHFRNRPSTELKISIYRKLDRNISFLKKRPNITDVHITDAILNLLVELKRGIERLALKGFGAGRLANRCRLNREGYSFQLPMYNKVWTHRKYK